MTLTESLEEDRDTIMECLKSLYSAAESMWEAIDWQHCTLDPVDINKPMLCAARLIRDYDEGSS